MAPAPAQVEFGLRVLKWCLRRPSLHGVPCVHAIIAWAADTSTLCGLTGLERKGGGGGTPLPAPISRRNPSPATCTPCHASSLMLPSSAMLAACTPAQTWCALDAVRPSETTFTRSPRSASMMQSLGCARAMSAPSAPPARLCSPRRLSALPACSWALVCGELAPMRKRRRWQPRQQCQPPADRQAPQPAMYGPHGALRAIGS